MRCPGIFRSSVIAFAFALSACGGGGGGDEQNPAGTQPPQSSGIGAAGGTVLGPNGSKVVVPGGALAVVTQIAVDQTSASAPPLPAGLTPIGQMFAFTPHGTTFAVPVTITMPFDPGAVSSGKTAALFKTNAQNQWVKVTNAAFGATSVSAQVSSFSFGQVVEEELPRTELLRTFLFFDMLNDRRGIAGTPDLFEVESIKDPAGDAVRVHDFGAASFDLDIALLDGTSVAANGIASGVVASAADGRTFQVAAEAPLGNSNVAGEKIGGASKLIQEQTFIKRDENATLVFHMPLARIETHDENAVIGRECPEDFFICNFIQGFLSYKIEAYRTDGEQANTFFGVGGTLALHGFAENWVSDPTTDIGSHASFWNDSDLEFRIEDPNGASDSHAILTLVNPRTYAVDLSSIEVGAQFHVHIEAFAHAYNQIAGPPSELRTAAGAYMNFEAPGGGGGGGAMLESTGLEPVATQDVPDPPPLVIPPSCVPGPSNSGTLQFSRTSYTTRETENDPPTVTVTRVGGTNGVVTAVFTTSNGSATENADYEPVLATVFFGDGDDEPRVAQIPIIEDSIAETNETVQLTLSQPGACGSLGSQDTATLTIVDNDTLPGPSGIDETFGDLGKAALRGFGGDRSGMALQPDGKVIMVGGTFTDFIMARFNANGSIDADFGDNGKVTTNIFGSDASLPQEANAVAVQRDGKIVVAGSATIPRPDGRTAIALVRYNSDGSIDTSFNGTGFAFGPTFIFGRAFAVAIDSRDRIVVAGDTFKPSTTDSSDFIVARFNANGTVDSSFNQGAGFNVTDINGVANEGHGLEVLADDSLIVSGFAPIRVSNVNGTTIVSDPLGAVVKYQENGFVDQTFGAAGRVALPGDNVGRGLAVQSDGRIVLAGSIAIGTFPTQVNRFALMRLLANGTVDTSFGDGGRVQTSLTDRGDEALGVALQADGKIVAGGRSNGGLNSNFAVARYDRDGDLDTGFSEDGKLTIDFFGSDDIAENVAIQSDGKIVLGGLARDNVDGYGVARVLP
jgi:uncharacterized delta-60 repeat protein